MASDEELLNIILGVKSQGLAEADAVNAILAKTGNQSLALQTQVQGLTKAQAAHNLELQTANTLTASYGGKLTAQEAAYAKMQLSGGLAAAAERSVASEANAAARAAQALGADGAKVFDRLAALGAVTGGGGFGAIGAAIIGGGVALELGRSMVSNAEKNTEAQLGLAQAFQTQGKSVVDYQAPIDAFLNKNRRFIADEYEVKQAFASATRAGNDWTTTQRIVNDALDLSAAKHVSVTDATKILIDAEKGRAMGLLDLGISVKDIVDPQKELEKATVAATKAGDQKAAADRTLAEEQVKLAEKHHISNSELMHLQDLQHKAATTTGPAHELALRALAEAQVRVADSHRMTQSELMHLQDIQGKATDAAKDYADANQAVATAQQVVKDKGSKVNEMLSQVEGVTGGASHGLSDLKQAQHDLNMSWDDFSNKNGPAFENELATIIDYVNHHAIPALGQLNTAISPGGALDTHKIGSDQHNWIVQQLAAADKWLHDHNLAPGAASQLPDPTGYGVGQTGGYGAATGSGAMGQPNQPPVVITVNAPITITGAPNSAATAKAAQTVATAVAQAVGVHMRGLLGP